MPECLYSRETLPFVVLLYSAFVVLLCYGCSSAGPMRRYGSSSAGPMLALGSHWFTLLGSLRLDFRSPAAGMTTAPTAGIELLFLLRALRSILQSFLRPCALWPGIPAGP